MPTATPTPVVGFVVSEPLCEECLSHGGLCEPHSKSVLPQLAQPHWYRLISSSQTEDLTPRPEESTSVLKAKRRVANRLRRAMLGEFTKSRRATVAGLSL